MSDVAIHISDVDSGAPEPEPEPEPEPVAPVIVPVQVPTPDAVSARLDAIEATLNALTAFTGRIEALSEIQADLLDELADDYDETDADESDSVYSDTMEDMIDGGAQTGQTQEANGVTEQQDNGTGTGGENSADESPHATHIWWRGVRN